MVFVFASATLVWRRKADCAVAVLTVVSGNKFMKPLPDCFNAIERYGRVRRRVLECP